VCHHVPVDGVSLRPIDDRNRAAVEALQVRPDQTEFVDGVRSSIEEAATYEKPPWYRAVYAGDIPVGFVMLADDDPTFRWRYYLWRMLIDARYQGRGFGRAALDHVVAYVRTRPGGDELVTSVANPDDERSPLAFYLRYGFVSTGEMYDHELLVRLDLRDRA
jgi:diamine N-acetyltransferase